ncbi:MAG: sugar ABC transporter substrate-binding protein [Firmicutes bacterium]|jgi:multiple sugar transport system substrate-binding protein|nr:sugar ABC transporter substrate-binding protein [Bacillota bacterium]
MSLQQVKSAWHMVIVYFIVVCLSTAMPVGATAQQRVELTFLSYFAVHNPELAERVIDDFNTSQDRIRVTLQISPGVSSPGHAEQILVRTAAGVAPDIFDVHPAQFYEFMRRGMFYDLTSVLRQDKAFNLEDFHPAVLESVKLDGRLYALPQRISMYVLFYNADLFAEAGLTPPSPLWNDPNWNWDAFRTAARVPRVDLDGDGIVDRSGAGISSTVNEKFLPFLWQAGGDIFDPDYTALTLDTPEAFQAIEYVRSGYQEGVFRTGGVTQLVGGAVAMAVDIPPTIRLLRENAIFDWDVAALPIGPKGAATTIQPIPHGISAFTRYPAEAIEFFKYFHSAKVGVLEAQHGIHLQPRRSVVTSKAFADNPPPRNVQSFLYALDVARPIPDKNLNFSEIMRMVNRALSPVWRGEEDPRSAVASVKDAVASLLQEGKQ